MFGFGKDKMSADQSFLPEDYLAKRAERRTNLLALTLFVLVMVGVVGAFLVTNRQWKDVQGYQEAINVQYSQAAQEIEQLKQLEAQKGQLLAKAELTTALIERVPRSILLAEIINRMPEDMTLLEFELKSQKVAAIPVSSTNTQNKNAISRTSSASAPALSTPAVTAPQYQTRVMLVGVTTTHNKVARFGAALQECPLLTNVELKYSERTKIQGNEMNRFRIEADVMRGADARRLEPLANPTLENVDSIAGGETEGVPAPEELELTDTTADALPSQDDGEGGR